MSWRNRGAWICLLPLWLSACGFQPLYSQAGAGAKATVHELAGVEIEPIAGGLTSQQLYNDLEDRLNPGKIITPSRTYRLKIDLHLREVPVAISRDGTISRYNVFMDTDYVLSRTSDGKPVYQGKFSRSSSYNVQSNAYFSTYVSRADAIRRGITELAEEYRQRLAAFLVQQGGKLAPPIVLPEAPPEGSTPAPLLIPSPVQDNLPSRLFHGPGT